MSDDAIIPQVSVADAKAAIDAGEVQVIDTRPSFDFAGERIPNAVSLPNRSLATRTEQLDRSKRILFVSEDGGQSEDAAQLAQSLGFTNVATIEGGFDAWLDAGYPTHSIDDGT